MSGLPDGMANGPSQSDLNGKDAQIWERPWTLDEMRQTSANWSLAADSGLFLFLQDFSQRMLSKTHEIEKQLDGLIRDTKATDSCLHTVFNDFLMLSNTQFIENRVYDEEVEEPVPKVEAAERQPEPEKTREQKEAELIPKMQEAVNYGLKVLESAFEQLDIKAGNSDSEDEESADRVEPILEPKDLYVERPLPYLIGSQLFMEQEDVGLGDLSSEEMSIDSDRDSVIESEDGKEQSDEDFDQEGEGQGSIKKKSSMLSYEEEDEDGDSDIFGDSDKDDDDDDDDDEDRENTAPSTFADQLAARIKGEPVSKPEGDRTSLSSASKRKSKAKKEPTAARPLAAVDDDGDELFKPPKMEDEDLSPFGGKGGLFSGGRGLFDDDDEGDLFSDAPQHLAADESTGSRAKSSEPAKPAKKIPPGGAVPDNSLFGSANDSDSRESRENGSPVRPRTQTAPKQAPAGGAGGLFDDDEEDDFFGGKSLKKSSSAGQEKAKPKKAVDLFGGDDEDEDGDIFNERSSAPPPLQSKKEAVEEQVKQAAPEKKKKVPAGGVAVFGPGTKTLLAASEASEKSEENGPPPDISKAPAKPAEKPQTRSLFSDDEDSQGFPSVPKSQSKPETTTQSKAGKAPLSIFDDEGEEQDLFASAAKSKSSQSKATTPEVKKPLVSSLFSDDEDQWMSSKPSAPEAKPGGMKPSVSAPSSLHSASAAQTGSLFDEDDDDLFAAAKSSSQKKPQRVALLFEDEEEDKGFLFGFKPPANNITPPAVDKASVVASPAPSLFDSEKVATPRPSDGKSPDEERAVAAKSPEAQSPASPPEGGEAKKKPAGAVSLFGGIDVLANKPSRSPLDRPDGRDDFLAERDSSPPVEEEEEEEKKEEKDVKTKNSLSLFDDEEEEVADWTAPISIPSKPASKNTLQTPEERTHSKTSGVFQDEELLFSRTQQRDNDPDVDLFATTAKGASTKAPSTAKAAATAPTLFADDDEDDLFSSIKPKAPPPVSEKPCKPSKEASAPKAEAAAMPEESAPKPVATTTASETEKPAASRVKAKEPASRIGKLQANLQINPAALLPGAVSRVPGGVSVLPGMSPSVSSGGPGPSPSPSPSPSPGPSPSPITSPVGTRDAGDGATGFDFPAQVATLESANKGRPKGSVRRRPQTRAARQLAAQISEGRSQDNQGESSGSNPAPPSLLLPNPPSTNQDLPGPTPDSRALPKPGAVTTLPPQPPPADGSASVLTLPGSTSPKKTSSARGSSRPRVLPSPDVDDLFGSDTLFASAPAPKQTAPSPKPTTKTADDGADGTAAPGREKARDSPPSIFDDHGGDLFRKVKPRSAQKPKASAFLEEEDNVEDIFGLGKSSTPTAAGKTSSSFVKQDIFQDEAEPFPKANKKHKDKSLDASLFDDNVDIFADLTVASKPKQKSKKKVETKSIFDDDMDDIFSSNAGKAVAKPSVKSQKSPPSHGSSAADDSSGNIFDDPLNALGGN